MYSFVRRTIPENYRELYKLEKVTLAKRGLSVWSWQGRFTKAIVAYLSFLAVLFAVGGIYGLGQIIPRSDLVLEVPGAHESLQRMPVVERAGEIIALRKLTHDILELEVKIDVPVTYRAGQYCEIYVPGVILDEVHESRSYSFASPPGHAPVSVVRFQVRLVPGGAFTTWLHTEAKVGQRLEGHGPYGDFWLRPGKAPILAIAGGSGMAPLKALLEQACGDGVARDIKYFFGAWRQEDFYCVEEMKALEAAWLSKFEFIPVLSGEPEDSDWQGPRGFVSEHVRTVLGDRIADYHVYMCGPPPMLDSAEKIVLLAGSRQRTSMPTSFTTVVTRSRGDKPFSHRGAESADSTSPLTKDRLLYLNAIYRRHRQ